MEHEEDSVEDNAHIGCYIFKPATVTETDEEQRPRKKRKISQAAASEHSEEGGITWPSLFAGKESQQSIANRQKKFQEFWALRQNEIEHVVNQVDESLVNSVLKFVRSPDGKQSQAKLRTGLIVSGPTKNTQRDLLQGWQTRTLEDVQEIFVELHPSQCPNLQVTLKTLIRMAISQHKGSQEYTTFLAKHKALIPMNFDLEILQRYVEQHQISRVILLLADVETFDTGILSEFISMTSSWLGRIPFQLLINIATTVELFESRISRSIASLLDAEVFQSANDTADPLYKIYSAVQHNNDTDIFLGPTVLKVLAELAEDQSTTTATFTRAIKYAFMTHFFANPLSTLDSKTTSDPSNDKKLCQAVRCTPGFKERCEQLAKGEKASRQRAHEVMSSDEALFRDALEVLQTSRTRLRNSLAAVQMLHTIYYTLEVAPVAPLDLEVQLITSLPRLLESDVYLDIETAVIDLGPDQFHDFTEALAESVTTANLPSESPSDNNTELEKFLGEIRNLKTSQSATDSPQQRFMKLLSTHLEVKLQQYLEKDNERSSTTQNATPATSPFQSYLHEATVLHTRSPLTAVLHARPRYALERALIRPADYLGCECCAADKHGEISDRSALPATSLLLTLLNEAGNIVNVRDLWDAFREIVAGSGAAEGVVEDAADDGDGDDEDKINEDRRALALFYGALADLRHLGLVRSSKRKPGVECVVKTAWMGL
ncbi:hypothetical protein LTR84_004544 [Exophiala bonariae]|uniref:Origin recognition complex subunit 3 winged helix C-terminal domain-containing protein n=1 Tax=Exophiala bonariae TaxID=1690606 RepID=A0AAV9NR34_9EURO|nr:hypothetical protein LTR84_004544 [Exophiala bonariae]